jgi:hypothetical protein
MDIGSILILLAILLLVANFLSQPFFELEKKTTNTENDYSHLLAERERLLDRIQELDFDYDLNKISDEDYQRARKPLVRKTANIMREIDTIKEERGIEKTPPPEEALRRSPRKTEVDDIESLIASRRRKLGEKKKGFCPRCGRTVNKSDQYCVHCGEKLQT